MAEQDLAQLGAVTEGYFHYSNHFRGLELVGRDLVFDYNPDGGRAFKLGLVQAGLILAGAIIAIRQVVVGRAPETYGRFRWRILYLVVAMLIAMLMITPLTRALWDHLPLLPFTQFPWRFLSVASFLGALLVGAIVLAFERPVVRATIAIAGSLVMLLSGLAGLQTDYLILTDADVTAERLAQYEWFTGNIGTTVSAEYLTPEANPRPWTSAWLNAGQRDRVVAISGRLESAELLDRDGTGQTWRLAAGDDGAEVLFSTLYWPGWRGQVDGRPVALRAFPGSGLIALDVPRGEHTVTLALGRTPVRLAAEVVSFLAAVIAFVLLVSGRPAVTNLRRMMVPLAGALALVLALALLWRPVPDLSAGNLNWDFAQMGYLHHSPGGVLFEDGTLLHAYQYSADEIVAGDTLTISLSLAPGQGREARVDLVTPASARPVPHGTAEPPSIATRARPLDGNTIIFELVISTKAPAGLYIPRLTIDAAQPLMPSGGTRGDLFLRPVRVLSAGDGREPDVAVAADILDVRLLSLVELEKSVEGQFAWLTTSPLGGRYQVSWRILNGEGAVLSQLDTQPGYGYQPTDGWAVASPVHDWLALQLPESLAGPPPYALVTILYDPTTGEELLTRRLGVMQDVDGRIVFQSVKPVFTPPAGVERLDISFREGDRPVIWLHGYEQSATQDMLSLTLHWQALSRMTADYARFVHLIDDAGNIVAQVDGNPVSNSYPTSQWIPGEVVADTVTFDLADLPEGEYRLATGFYRPGEGGLQLEAVAPEGSLPDGRALLPEVIVIPAP